LEDIKFREKVRFREEHEYNVIHPILNLAETFDLFTKLSVIAECEIKRPRRGP